MAKTKDLFLNIAANPNMTLEDLVSVGLTSENTMLLDRALYASNEKVQNMFKDSEGKFDEKTFNAFYDIAEQSYNLMALDEINTNLMEITAYDVDNIFVDPSKRRKNNAPYIVKLPNPDRLSTSITRIGKTSERTLSLDEIAQTQQVLLNPVAVSKGEKPIWGDAPNDSWFNDFWETRVMAAWDEDGTHIDPVTGKEVQHKKGELKLNENGTYYYENLDGRSVYGKRVLNKFNTLTTDGSFWNKYDFFDSDDIEQKSAFGSIAKNLALVGSMFIPYVGWGVAAASVAHQSAGLFATLGKMLAGSDSETLNSIEGWVKSTDRRNLKTEYAQLNMWCWENFIDLIGDTTAQLREQRAIFKFAPGIIKGDFKALNQKAMDDYAAKIAKESMEKATKLSFNDLVKLAKETNPQNWKQQLNLLMAGSKDVFSAKADKMARDYVTNYYKLGEPIAKAYMTAITVLDTFGEAIEAGASDGEATLLTLGYAAAEAALLSTDLGKWIMPELRQDRMRHKMIAKKLLELPKETREMSKLVSRLSGETRKSWAKRLFNIGKDIANAEYSTMKKTVGSVVAQGIGEGIEEVSEEALADFSKSCFNLVQQLQGDDVRLNAWNHNWSWSDAANRYGMSLVGGIMGGGINAAASDYKANHDLLNMTSQQAMQQLVYMSRNNELDDFWKTVNKTELASKELSTKLNDSGTGYKPGTKEDNQDLEAKRALRAQVQMIESIINAENAKLNDSGLLSALIKADPTLKDLDPVKEYRMRALSNSATAGRFLNEWNTITSDIVKNRIEQNKIHSKYGDKSNEKYSEEDQQQLKVLGNALKELQNRKEAMLDGTRTREYVRDALFEMTHAVNELWDHWGTEIRFAEYKTGKKYADISETERKALKEQYEALRNSNQYAEKVHELAGIYEAMASVASDGIIKTVDFYNQTNEQVLADLTKLSDLSEFFQTLLQTAAETGGVEALQQVLDSDMLSVVRRFAESDENNPLLKLFKELDAKTDIEIAAVNEAAAENGTLVDPNAIENIKRRGREEKKKIVLSQAVNSVELTYQNLIKAGFVHPENKRFLSNLFRKIDGYAGLILDGPASESPVGIALEEQLLRIGDLQKLVDLLPSTPILQNLEQFQLALGAGTTMGDLFVQLAKSEGEYSSNMESLLLDKVTLDNFVEARNILQMYRAAIVGARFDNVDIDTIIGFNTTLNELTSKDGEVTLAEIDANTADMILLDLDILMKKLDYLETIHNLNVGNKFNLQNKTALNKLYILFNKTKHFISVIQDDKEWEEGLDDLQAVIQRCTTLAECTGRTAQERSFAVSPTQKELIEKQSIELLEALHTYLNKHINGSEATINKLSKVLTYDNFKGLIRLNDDFLSSTSDDIDDSAFIWWLCATAAQDPHQFYNNYRHIIGLEKDGEKPLAPIPTLELGVFAMTAAITNGEMFKIFGKALRQSLLLTWELATPEVQKQIEKDYGDKLLVGDKVKSLSKNNDFLPNFDNIVFIEGIAGSGKTKGVLVTLGKLLANSNPEFMNSKVFFAHTDTDKANDNATSTSFTNYETKDHDSLLKYMSSNYVNRKTENGVYKYVIGRDVNLVDGVFRSVWELLKYDPNTVPKVIFIDEWSHYNLLELELIQRFCLKYGTVVIAMGDYDQLTPKAEIYKTEQDSDMWVEITPNRNMMPRVAKFGVSMRTDNEIKNSNIYNMLAWKRNPTALVNLHYYEDETGIYGDKVHNVASSYGSELDLIKLDVKKMISTLKNKDEKIGYVYYNPDSELYKWLTTTEGVKEHILPYSETDAHGREAQYYIVENNRSENLEALSYFESAYTGITRSGLGSIIIAPYGRVHTALEGKHNEVGISLKSVQDSTMLPSTFTDDGTRDFARKRKAVFDKIFGDEEITPFNISSKSTEDISLTRDLDGPGSTTLDDDFDNEPTPADDTPIEPPTPTDVGWTGALPKNLKLYNRAGIAKYQIVDENNTDPNNATYVVNDMESGETLEIPKADAESNYFLKTVNHKRHFNVGDLIVYKDELCVIEDIYLTGDLNNPVLVYKFKDMEVTHADLTKMRKKGDVATYLEMSEDEDVTPPVTVFETEGGVEYLEAVDSLFETSEEEQLPELVTELDLDIDIQLLGFTFNTQYFADKFDPVTNLIVILLRDALRIDNGYGLNKLSLAKWSHKLQIEKDLGSLRLHLEFSSNADILKHLSTMLRRKNLSLRWGFVSKSATDSNGRYARYNPPLGALEHMQREDLAVPLKTLSAIVYDDKNNPILEIPMVTLQSPHSILRSMKKLGIALDIASLWNFGKKTRGEEEARLNNIINAINTNHSGQPGFQHLASICQLWLFTNNGVQLLPLGWNLHSDTLNKGNIYVTLRISDSIEEHNFSGDWVDLTSIQRKDRFISNIMMNNRYDRPTNPLTGDAIPVFREYVPYVFISDDPTITSDVEAAKRYLQLLMNPLMEKSVKVIPVVPPEISVSEYIKAVTKVLREGSNDAPYGNHFTAYRIFDAILKSPNANTILGTLNERTRKFVKDCVAKLNEIKTNNPIQEDESKIAYKQRIALLQNKILKENYADTPGKAETASAALLAALVDCYAYTLFGTDTYGDENILKLILEACDSTTGPGRITGVLCKPKFKRDLKGKGIQGFAYNVVVDDINTPRGKYSYPGHGSFRIFGKLDTPTYNLTSLLPHIDFWAKNAVKGRTVYNKKTGREETYENVWHFVNDAAETYYLPQPETRKINLEEVRKNYRSLLAKLGIDELYIDTSELENCTSEAEAIQKVTNQINKLYLNTNGAFIVRDSKGNFKYGNIISDRTPEFKNYKFDSLQTSQEGYKLRFVNLDTNSIEEIDMTLDPNTDTFSIIPPAQPLATTFNVSEQLAVILESIKKSLSYKNADDNKKAVFELIFACYDVNTNTVDVATINQLLLDNFSMLSIPTIVKNLKLKEIEGSAIDENVCINPIKIKFK